MGEVIYRCLPEIPAVDSSLRHCARVRAAKVLLDLKKEAYDKRNLSVGGELDSAEYHILRYPKTHSDGQQHS